MRKFLFEIEAKHIQNQGRGYKDMSVLKQSMKARQALGIIQKCDIGKHVFDVDGVIQVENNEQRDARLQKGDTMKPTITPAALRKLTEQTKDERKQEREMKLKKEYEAKLRLDKQAAAKADGIIEKIPDIATKAAKDCQSEAVVMRLTYGEYQRDGGTAKIDPKNVGGKAALLVWDWCAKQGFNPTLEEWSDGAGIEGGYELTIHW